MVITNLLTIDPNFQRDILVDSPSPQPRARNHSFQHQRLVDYFIGRPLSLPHLPRVGFCPPFCDIILYNTIYVYIKTYIYIYT